MRVIARDKCFINGVLYRVGAEFDYVGPLDPDGSLPKFLAPADADSRKELADARRLQVEQDIAAAEAAAGPKRGGERAVKVPGMEYL